MMSFDDALEVVEGEPNVLLGNGFSLALSDRFSYDALLNQAEFKEHERIRQAFDVLGTTDFERVMEALRAAAKVLELYPACDPGVREALHEDAGLLREVLVSAIADNHLNHPGEISEDQYRTCRTFLRHFKSIYTLNYDLLLYWALMQDEVEPLDLTSDDGFRKARDGETGYVTWEPGRYEQKIHYLHGALHLFDSETVVKKFTWVGTGIPLIEQVRQALEEGLYPIFVSEGESDEKLSRIRHNDYLARAYRSFQSVSRPLFIFGHSLAANDWHILRLIGEGKTQQLFISLFGDEGNEENLRIKRRAQKLGEIRRTVKRHRPLRVEYFDAESASVWGS